MAKLAAWLTSSFLIRFYFSFYQRTWNKRSLFHLHIFLCNITTATKVHKWIWIAQKSANNWGRYNQGLAVLCKPAVVKFELLFYWFKCMICRYSLLAKGQPLAARCSEFDYAVQNLTQAASVPTIPVMGARFVCFFFHFFLTWLVLIRVSRQSSWGQFGPMYREAKGDVAVAMQRWQ